MKERILNILLLLTLVSIMAIGAYKKSSEIERLKMNIEVLEKRLEGCMVSLDSTIKPNKIHP